MNSDGVAALRDISTDFLMNCSLSTTLQPADRDQAFIYSKQDNDWQFKKTINEASDKGILFGECIAVAGNTFVANTSREPGIESIANNVAAITCEKQNDSWNKTDVLGDGKKSTFTFPSFNGINYSVQVSNNLKEWVTIEFNISGTGSEITKEYTLRGNALFFRTIEKTDPIIEE